MGSDRTRIFHLSDIHFGLEDNRALDWVEREIAERRPDAMAITGDLTMRARHREFAAATRWITSLDVPVTVEVGNHDMPYFNLVERFVAPYRRFRGMESVVERELDLPGLAIVPLKTAVRMQPRFNWSKGWISRRALTRCLSAIDALPPGTRALVTAHHPLREVGTQGTALTYGGRKALAELAARGVAAVLSGHVHDAFDIMDEIEWDGTSLSVTVRNLQDIATSAMQIDDVPEDALPPREPGDPVAPIAQIPRVDPPVY